MLQVRLYFDTGFDGVNIPATPDLLDGGDFVYEDVPAVDLLQRKGLGKLTIKRKYGYSESLHSDITRYVRTLENVDYIKITGTPEGNNNNTLGAVYYSVLGVEMNSPDTAILTILEDFITTAGGFARLKFNSGFITRRSGSNVTFGNKRKMPDEYLTCAYPMVYTSKLIGDNARPDRTYTLIESTIDLTRGAEVKVVTDPNDPNNAVSVPTMRPITGTTTYEIGTNINNEISADVVPNPTGARIYRVSPGGTIELGVNNARALGLEKSILSQYTVPQDMVLFSFDATSNTVRGRKKSFAALHILPTNIDLSRINTTVYQIAREGLIGASGERIEFSASELYLEKQFTGEEFPPRVIRVVDPRPEGRPYYRFAKISDVNSIAPSDFVEADVDNHYFRDYSVAGAKWVKLPFMFTEISGIDILEQKFKNTRRVEERQFAGQNAMLSQASALARLSEAGGYVGGGLNLIGSGINNIASVWGGGAENIQLGKAAGGAASMAGQALGFMGSHAAHMAATNMADIAQTTALGMYTLQRNKELYDYGVQITNVVPEVANTGDTNFMRDITQNKVVVYKIAPDVRDVTRLNKILKMFGEKDFTAIEASDDVWSLIGGRYFKYVRIQGAQICTNNPGTDVLPSYPIMSIAEREGAKAQLEAGIRMWLMSPKKYANIDDPTNYAV